MSYYRKDVLDMYNKALDAGGTALYDVRKAEMESLGSRTGRIGKMLDGTIAETPAKMFKAMEKINDIAAERKLRLASMGYEDEDGFIDVSPRAEAGDQVHIGKGLGSKPPEYPEGLTKKKIEAIITKESKLRRIDPTIAIKLFRAEGATSYQSLIREGSQKKEGGREASYGPFQLYTGKGLGKEYQDQTGRMLSEDNTVEGITTQIQFALDMAVDKGWTPWYGSQVAGIEARDGLDNAVAIYNWRDTNDDT